RVRLAGVGKDDLGAGLGRGQGGGEARVAGTGKQDVDVAHRNQPAIATRPLACAAPSRVRAARVGANAGAPVRARTSTAEQPLRMAVTADPANCAAAASTAAFQVASSAMSANDRPSTWTPANRGPRPY